jgi:hypothetical protein
MHRRRALLPAAFAGAAAAALVTASLAGATAQTHEPGFGHINNLAAGESTDLYCNVNASCLYSTNSYTGSEARGLTGWHTGPGTGAGVAGFTGSTSGNAEGVHGEVVPSSAGAFSAGVHGENGGTGGNGTGVRGSQDGTGWGGYFTAAGAGRGVNANAGNGGIGVHGNSGGGASLGYGVRGTTGSTAVSAAGVYGSISSSADYSAGVRGENTHPNCCGFGVVGFSAGQGIGIGGYAPNGFGVFGFSPYNWAAWLDGAVTITKDLHVYGTLYKAGGAFRIDNPVDPAHSYLQHSFVESPDMKNIYDGNVTTNAEGYATVTLPKWFQALNKDFRYQLTSLSGLQEVAVAKEIHDNQFTIQSEKPNSKVSWQVTGIRHDRYANAHRIQLVVPKTGADAGKYEHPELFGQPASKGVSALPARLKYFKQAMAPKAKTN